jgi:hypothetical protein
MLGDIVLNSSLSTPKKFATGHSGYSVLEHEIGHGLRLGDVPSDASATRRTIMDAASFPPVRDYSAVDQLALQALYGAVGTTVIPSTGAVAATPSGDSSTIPTVSDGTHWQPNLALLGQYAASSFITSGDAPGSTTIAGPDPAHLIANPHG